MTVAVLAASRKVDLVRERPWRIGGASIRCAKAIEGAAAVSVSDRAWAMQT